MQPDLARIAEEFMRRVNMTGAEVEAFAAVVAALKDEQLQEPVTIDQEAED